MLDIMLILLLMSGFLPGATILYRVGVTCVIIAEIGNIVNKKKLKFFGTFTSIMLTLLSPLAASFKVFILWTANRYSCEKVDYRFGKNGAVLKLTRKLVGYEGLRYTAGPVVAKSVEWLTLVERIPGLDWMFRYEVAFVEKVVIPEETIYEYGPVDDELREHIIRDVQMAEKRDWLFWMACVTIPLMSIGLINVYAVVVQLIIWAANAIQPRGVEPDSYLETGTKFNGQDGMYRVYKHSMFWVKQVGVAYAQDKTLYSRAHVTGNREVWMGSQSFGVSYHSNRNDYIAWGGSPVIAPIESGDRVMVAILPNRHDNVLYFKTTATELSQTALQMRSIGTAPGVSGSPMFVRKPGGEDWFFAGCYGSTFNSEAVNTKGERLYVEMTRKRGFIGSEHSVNITRGGCYQYVQHPGSGKTRNLVPMVCTQAAEFCERIVMCTPTVTVAKEFMEAVRLESLTATGYFKNYGKSNPSAKVRTTAHATALSALLRRKIPCDRVRTGYIIDESHVQDTKTMCLKALLRNRIKNEGEGFVLETSATAKIQSDQAVYLDDRSNYQITDVPMDEEVTFFQQVRNICKANPGKKLVVFVGSVVGVNGMMQLDKYLRGRIEQKIIHVYRKNFDKGYRLAKEEFPAGSVIITTNVSECGANYNADIVIDSMEQMRFRASEDGKFVDRYVGLISEAQMVQRRGRVGRRKPGIYFYYPSKKRNLVAGLLPADAAECMDRDIFVDSLGLEKYDNDEKRATYLLTPDQVAEWMGTTSDCSEMPHSARLMDILYARNGRKYTSAEVAERVRRFLLGPGYVVSVGKVKVGVQWWDERDREFLIYLLRKTGVLNEEASKEDKILDELMQLQIEVREVPVKRYALEPGKDYQPGDVVYVQEGVPLILQPISTDVEWKQDWTYRRTLQAVEEAIQV